MTNTQIKELIKTSNKYNFLKDMNFIFLTISGSYSYGTNIDTSDIDIRGCVFNNKNDIIGLNAITNKKMDVYEDENTDTVIYSFNKLIYLLLLNTPSALELLGCREEDYIYTHRIGKELIDNYNLFLSQRCINTYSKYAENQLSKFNSVISKGNKTKTNKYAMHIVRLYLMCIDILEKQKIITYRKNDKDLLLNIRNGYFQKSDGTYFTDYFDLIEIYKRKIEYAAKNTTLQLNPDKEKINNFVRYVNSTTLQFIK